jgi:dienelactone hydrolase
MRSTRIDGGTGRGGRHRVGVLLAVLLGAGLLPPNVASGVVPDAVLDCDAELGDPQPGTAEWEAAYWNTVLCTAERNAATASNPAYAAARAANLAAGSPALPVVYDPFRDAHVRWGGERGDFLAVTFPTTDPAQTDHAAMLFSPLGVSVDAPLPGVLLPSHYGVQTFEAWQWVAQALAEHGYVVMYYDVVDRRPETTTEALDWFLSDANPFHDRVDPERIGIVGHSGGASIAISMGHGDERFDAVVAYDGGGVPDTPRVPTMTQVADFIGEGTPPAAKPAPEGAKFEVFDALRDAGIDAMQVALRSSTHVDWLGTGCLEGSVGFLATSLPAVRDIGCGIYNEQVATYFTLAWFDRYLKGDADALARLTADVFDGSSDEYSIGTGVYDPQRALAGGSVEAGNVPITIEGMSIRNRLSFWYPSRYFLDGGALQCENIRDGCA